MELKIEREFQEKIPPLTEAEFEQLRENILNDGEVYEPIAVWNGIIVDGHNRWKIIKEHPEIPYRIKEMPFADKWAAFDWMYKKQLGRRNLSDEQKTYLIGKLYESRKKSAGGNGSNQYVKRDEQNAQNGQVAKTDKEKHGVSGEIALELNIGRNTVRRAEHFAKGVDALNDVSPEAAEKVLGGKTDLTKQDVSQIAKMRSSEIEEVAKAINGEKPSKKVTFPSCNRGKNKTPEAEADFELAISRDRDAVVEYTVADLLEEFRGINADFLRKYKTMFNFHNELIKDNASEVQAVIDEVKIEIERMEAF